MDFKEMFKVRPTSVEQNEFMITFGNQLATEQVFKTEKAAQMAINKTDWNLVACLASVIVQYELKKMNEESKAEEVKE